MKTPMIKIYGKFYPADNVAGVCAGNVITLDNVVLEAWKESPAFVEMAEHSTGTHCAYCHNELDGGSCMSCGADYAST
jgi:hypothetical protein